MTSRAIALATSWLVFVTAAYAQGSYDDLVALVNERAGAKVELTVKEATKVAALQRSISELQSVLPPDSSGQPTAADVSRAYAPLSSL